MVYMRGTPLVVFVLMKSILNEIDKQWKNALSMMVHTLSLVLRKRSVLRCRMHLRVVSWDSSFRSIY